MSARSTRGYKGGRPQTFTLPKPQEIRRIVLTDPLELYALAAAGGRS